MSVRLPDSRCLYCQRLMDAASVAGEEGEIMPDPGDITICLHCGHIMVFADDLTVRNLNDDEMYEIAGDKDLLAIQKARAELNQSSDPTRVQDSLVGKFFIEHDEKHQRYRTGHIKLAAGDTAYLLSYDNLTDGPVEPMEVVTVEELAETTECCEQKRWHLFNNRHDLTAFIEWMVEPIEKPKTSAKVVKLPKRSE